MSHAATPPQEKYLYIETFGCQMNVSDSEKIIGMLQEIGYRPTQDAATADLILLNTCSVRAKAEQKVYGHLGRYKGLKGGDRRVILGVGGCVAQQEGDRLLENVPYLDIVFGTHNLHLLPDLVLAAERGERLAEVRFLENEERLDLFPADTTGTGVCRFVTVMQGCDNFCSYCIVPLVRGREISRRSKDILDEIRGMAERGTREVTLLGQNVNSYGLKDPGEIHFPELLRKVAAIDGIERIRFTTSHPRDLSPELIACFADLPELCSHMHLPAQSGSDRILAQMGRGYTREEYLAKVVALRKARPDIQITGDMIVGFPGETEEDFAASLDLMREVGYADTFSFIYSPRPGTKAAEMPEELRRKDKVARLEKLQALQTELTLENNRRLIGTRQTVLVERSSKRGHQMTGRTSCNRIVNFAAGDALIGRMVDVRIGHVTQKSLQGEMVR